MLKKIKRGQVLIRNGENSYKHKIIILESQLYDVVEKNNDYEQKGMSLKCRPGGRKNCWPGGQKFKKLLLLHCCVLFLLPFSLFTLF